MQRRRRAAQARRAPRRWRLAAAATLSLPALWPLLRPGFFVSDDGLFHLYRLAALDEALRAGVLFPRWFPDFAFGYGFPVLNFYSPLGYYLAEAFQLVVGDAVVALKLAFAAALLLSGLAMYLFAREPLGRWGAALAALAYVYAPYHLADVYRRGALAESLAFVFFPLVLWSCRRLAVRRRWTDAAAAVAGRRRADPDPQSFGDAAGAAGSRLPAVLLLGERGAGAGTGVREGGKRRCGRPGPGCCPAGGWTVGLLRAAGAVRGAVRPSVVRLITAPATSSTWRRWTASSRPGPSYRYFPDQGVAAERPLGLAQAVLVAATLPVLALRIRRRQPWRGLAFWWAALLVSLGMTLALSLPVWQVLQPALSMIQYPWRFMGLVDLSAAVLDRVAAGSRRRGTPGRRLCPPGAEVLDALVAFGAVSVALMGNALPNLPTPVAAAHRRAM